MRIADPQSFFAVLCLAACVLLRSATSSSRQGDSSSDRLLGDWDTRHLSTRELQMLIRNASGERGDAVECCPSKRDMVMPVGGTLMEGGYVELFQVYEQSFYEVSCLDSVVGKPCRFIDRRLQSQSKCVQKYSYSYALVRDDPASSSSSSSSYSSASLSSSSSPSSPSSSSSGPAVPGRHPHRGHPHAHQYRNDSWRMDYIRVRSGCSCEITPKNKKKRAAKKAKRRRPASADDLQMS